MSSTKNLNAQLLPLPIIPLIPCFATLGRALTCQDVISIGRTLTGCPPTIISDQTGIMGCQSGQFTIITQGENNLLRVPCGGCYSIDLSVAGRFTEVDPAFSNRFIYFGICKNANTDFLISPGIVVLPSNITTGDTIPFNVSTSGTVCLQAGDLIAPCAGFPLQEILPDIQVVIVGLTMKVIKIGSC